jgi:hypothetical protein
MTRAKRAFFDKMTSADVSPVRQTDTPAFKRWFGDSKVVDKDGKPLVVYHGTTQQFDVFDRNKGNIEGHYGKVFYFTDSKSDVKVNYAGEGPDLTAKIDRLAEQIMQSDVYEKGDEARVDYGTKEYKDAYSKAREEAKSRLNGGKKLILDVYIKMKNPIRIGVENPTYFEIKTDRKGNEKGSGVSLYNALIEVADEYDADGQEIWSDAMGKIGSPEFSATEFDDALRNSDNLLDMYDDNGDLASNDFISSVYDLAGFDGIIMNAYDAFGKNRKYGQPMTMKKGTKHYIVFSPTQIKSATKNDGTFNPKDPSILKQTAMDEVASHVSTEPTKEDKPTVRQFLDRVYTAINDDLYPVKKFSDLAEKSGAIEAVEQNPYVLSRLAKGWAGEAEYMLEYGSPMGKSFKQIITQIPKDTLKDFSAYLVARRSIKLSERVRTEIVEDKEGNEAFKSKDAPIETGIPVEVAKKAVKEFEDKYPKFAEVAEDIYSFQDSLIKMMVDNGLLSAEQSQRMHEMNLDYVPFYRVMNDAKSSGLMGKKLANVKAPIKRIKGSKKDIVDPLESIIQNTYTTVSAVKRNNVAKAIVEAAEKTPLLGQFIERDTNMDAAAELMKTLKDLDGGEEAGQFPVLAPFMFQDKNTISVVRNGKPEAWKVEQDLRDSLLSMNEEQANMVVKALNLPVRLLRAGATTFSLDFPARNVFRDQLSAFVNSSANYRPFIDAFRGMFSYLTKDKYFKDWMRSGGWKSTLVTSDREIQKRKIAEFYENDFQRIAKYANPLKAIEAFSDIGEQATRLGEYRRVIEKGGTPLEGAMSSRNVSLDFAKQGTATRTANKIIAFLSANINGIFRPFEELKRAPGRFLAKNIASLTIPSIIFWAMGKDDEDIEEVPSWQKALFWVFKVGDKIVRLPKPPGIGQVFASIPEAILDYVYKQDKEAGRRLAGQIIDSVKIDVIPTAIKPMVEYITGYSLFSRRNMEGAKASRMLPEDRYNLYTSSTAKALGRLIGQSPVKIDNLIRGYTGGAGKYILDGIDLIINKGETKLPVAPETAPLTRAFTVKEPTGTASESVQNFYENYDKIMQAKWSIDNARKAGDTDRVDAIIRKYPQVKAWRAVFQAGKEIAEYSAAIRGILENDSMDKEDKVERIRTIGLRMREKAKKVNEYLDGIE